MDFTFYISKNYSKTYHGNSIASNCVKLYPKIFVFGNIFKELPGNAESSYQPEFH